MAYIYRQKFDLRELISDSIKPAQRILFIEVDDILYRIYCQHFNPEGYELHRASVDSLHKKVKELEPVIIFVNIDIWSLKGNMVGIIESAINNFPHIPFISVARHLDGELLRDLMDAGITSHVDRDLTTPRDLVIIAKNVLI